MPDTTAVIRYDFEGLLTVRTAEKLRQQLIDAAQCSGNIEINCSGSTEIDLSFIQILLSIKTSAQKSGLILTFSTPVTPILIDTLVRAGIDVDSILLLEERAPA